ncbi:MAG: glutamate-1-semialdehyde-2,1-aminomutase, partial [Planctomycetota bacterium]
LKSVDGKEYIDFVGSWGPLILGYSHPKIVEALKEEASKATTFGAPTALEVELAKLVVEMVPSVEMVRMVNSGTEATMSAIRLARAFTGREKILKFSGCYHGHGDSFLIQAGSGAATLGIPSSPGVPKELAALTLVAEFNNLEEVEQIFQNQGQEISCVILEPVVGNMGVIPPEKGFLEGLRRITKEWGALLIFDEVMTGFRVSRGGAQEKYKIQPDLTTLGKVIGGGLPVGAYGGKKEIMEQIAPAGPVYQAGTLSGNPLAMRAGLETLKILKKPGFYENLEKQGGFLEQEIQTIIQKYELPLSFVRIGAMACLFFRSSPPKNSQEAKDLDQEKFKEYYHLLLEEGIYMPPSPFEAFFLSSAHTEEILERALEGMEKALKQAFRRE